MWPLLVSSCLHVHVGTSGWLAMLIVCCVCVYIYIYIDIDIYIYIYLFIFMFAYETVCPYV